MNKLLLLVTIVAGSATWAAEPQWRSIRAHDRWITAIAFSPNGRSLATASDDHTLKVWDTESSKLRWRSTRFAAPVTAVAWSADGRMLYCSDWAGNWQERRADAVEILHRVAAHRENITALALSPNGELLATTSGDDRCRLWNRATRRCVLTIDQENEYDATCVAFSPDSKYVVVGDGENGVKLYRVTTGELLITFTGHTETVSAVAFTPDGKQIVTGSWDDTVRTWDAATGVELHTVRGHTDDVTALAVHPEGYRVFSASADRSVRGFCLKSGKQLFAQENLASAVTALAVSSDGRQLAVGCKEQLLLGESPR